MTTKVKRPPLRYHGGKWLLGKWIISNFPKHRVYVEGFGGGGSVLLQKRRSYAEVYNDLWGVVVNVFEVLRDPASAEELKRRIYLTPFSRAEYQKCNKVYMEALTDPIEKARLTIFRSLAGFGSGATNYQYDTGFRANSNRSGSTPAKDWMNYPNHIDSLVERLRGVIVESKDYREVIAQHDGKDTLIYLDPPYVHSTRNLKRGNAAYAYEMTDQDHVAMAEAAHRCKGMVVISGYDCPLYQDLFKGWKKVERAALADGAAKRVECLWLNQRVVPPVKTLF